MSHRTEKGQTTAEYLGVLVVVAAIVAALVLAQPGRLIGSGVRAKVCDIAREPCGRIEASAPEHHRQGGIGGFLSQAVHGVGTGLDATGRAVGGVGIGVYEGVRDPVVMGYKLSPLRATVDPHGFAKDVGLFGQGLAHGVTHPAEMAKAAVDWDTWADDPARAIGHLLPTIVVTVATAGSGKAALTGEEAVSAEMRAAAETEMRAAAENEMRTTAEAATKAAAKNAATNAAEHAAATAGRRMTAAMLRRLLRTGDGEAVFWSGLGKEGDRIAALYTSKHGGTTLEQLLDGKHVKMPDFHADPAIWEQASDAFAMGARGTVRVILGDSVDPSSVWQRIERPALEANRRVTKIVAINPHTGAESVIFVR